jgi:hypothetical protein
MEHAWKACVSERVPRVRIPHSPQKYKIMEEIYSYHARRGTSFETTLMLLQDLLMERLSPEWRRIWVQASNSGRTKFCFTIFPSRGEYTMRFLDVGSFRQFRTDGNLDEEMEIIERFIDSLSEGILNDVII